MSVRSLSPKLKFSNVTLFRVSCHCTHRSDYFIEKHLCVNIYINTNTRHTDVTIRQTLATIKYQSLCILNLNAASAQLPVAQFALSETMMKVLSIEVFVGNYDKRIKSHNGIY